MSDVKSEKGRVHGLDTLRSTAILMVFMHHFSWLTHQKIFGPFGHLGGMGVDLFFSLSGYLIGDQIFLALKSQNGFSLTTFYTRRFLRTLPNYLFVLGLYFSFPSFRENPLETPFWKFLTFTQNFGLTVSGAFSHAWSLCIEEQFYLFLPLLAMFLFRTQIVKYCWVIICSILLGEIAVRGLIWLIYLKNAVGDLSHIYLSLIYAPTFTRLDALVLGVSLALMKNFQFLRWQTLTKHGNYYLLFGIVGYCGVTYFFQTGSENMLFSAVFYYSLLSLSSALLTLSALSPHSILNQTKILGARKLAVWSYAIYLIHKPMIHFSLLFLTHWNLNDSTLMVLLLSILLSLVCGWILYTFIETPFLKLRDRMRRVNFSPVAQSGV